ncbi:hypothetical protein AAG570_002019 [Ranatra chinensis]|uniref:Uncharacterized protein n=1 Tax=Ranatra chinensis TaxID=642074 RepID=A0ABD0YC37_9HEMI
MASKRRNMFYENKKQETTEIRGRQRGREGTIVGPVRRTKGGVLDGNMSCLHVALLMLAVGPALAQPLLDEGPAERFFLDNIFNKYGNNGVITFETLLFIHDLMMGMTCSPKRRQRLSNGGSRPYGEGKMALETDTYIEE